MSVRFRINLLEVLFYFCVVFILVVFFYFEINENVTKIVKQQNAKEMRRIERWREINGVVNDLHISFLYLQEHVLTTAACLPIHRTVQSIQSVFGPQCTRGTVQGVYTSMPTSMSAITPPVQGVSYDIARMSVSVLLLALTPVTSASLNQI